MTTRVLLTGAAGFLGAHVLRRWLATTDWEFSCPVTFRNKGLPERLRWAVGGREDPNWRRVRVFMHDLASPVSPLTAGDWGPVDLIANFASDTHPPRSVMRPVEFVHNNVDITLYLLEYARHMAAQESGPPLFVQVSTDSVYGPALTGMHHEWDPIIPNNPYSASKAAQEALAIAWWRSYRLPVLIASTMNPTGVTQDREKFVPMTIGKVLRGETVTVHADAAGNVGARTYIHAPEMADGLLHVLQNYRKPILHGPGVDRPPRWNIVGQTELDNLVVATTIAAALDLPLHYDVQTVDRPEHGHRYALSPDRLTQAGWSANPDIEGAISRMARWSVANSGWLT